MDEYQWKVVEIMTNHLEAKLKRVTGRDDWRWQYLRRALEVIKEGRDA